MKSYLLVFAAIVGVSTVVTWVVRGLSERFGILPEPDARHHIHNQPISRLGGAAIFLTFCCFLLLLYAGSPFGFAPGPAGGDLPKILVPAVLLLATSLLDDLRALRERTKLLVQIHT
jgi:UDP-N-acetylmuramyl pentapeptide phosphotransferase/UDP-N-acetylglucosamine-1-phosphate transferase